MASNLRRESEEVKNRITVHYGLREYLDHTRDKIPPLDKNKIATSIADILKDRLLERAAEKGYQLGVLYRYDISPFLTERPQTLAVDFELSFGVEDISIPSTDEFTDGVEIVAGNCSFTAGCSDIGPRSGKEQIYQRAV